MHIAGELEAPVPSYCDSSIRCDSRRYREYTLGVNSTYKPAIFAHCSDQISKLCTRDVSVGVMSVCRGLTKRSLCGRAVGF